MILLYFNLAIAGILGGIIMIATGLDLHWQGALAILVGLVALAMGIREVISSYQEANGSGNAPRPLDGPYTAEDFPPEVPTTDPSGRRFREMVTISGEEPAVFVVIFRNNDYASMPFPQQVDDPGAMGCRRQLDLAFRASPEAEMGEPIQVGIESCTGLWEDAWVWRESRVTPTSANVTALRAVQIDWDEDACRLADPFAVSEREVEKVRQAMRHLAHNDSRNFQRFLDRIRAARSKDTNDVQPPVPEL